MIVISTRLPIAYLSYISLIKLMRITIYYIAKALKFIPKVIIEDNYEQTWIWYMRVSMSKLLDRLKYVASIYITCIVESWVLMMELKWMRIVRLMLCFVVICFLSFKITINSNKIFIVNCSIYTEYIYIYI